MKKIIAILIVLIVIGVFMVVNSEAYKTKKASNAMLKGEYSDALVGIQTIYTPEADSIRSYLTVLEKRDLITEYFDKSTLSSYGEYVTDFFDAVQSFSDSTTYYYLPEELKKQCDYYKKISEEMTHYLAQFYWYISNVQDVLLNDVIQNREYSFTLNMLKENVDNSNDVLLKMEQFFEDKSGIINWKDCGEYTELFGNCLEHLLEKVEKEIVDSNLVISYGLAKGYGMNDTLYLEDANEEYSKIICEELEPVIDSDSIENNAKKLYFTLSNGMCCYYINQYEF